MRNNTQKVVIEVRLSSPRGAVKKPGPRKMPAKPVRRDIKPTKPTRRPAPPPAPAPKRSAWRHAAVFVIAALGVIAAVHFAGAREATQRQGFFRHMFQPAPVAVQHTAVRRTYHRPTKAVSYHHRTTHKKVAHHYSGKHHSRSYAHAGSAKTRTTYRQGPLKTAGDFAGDVVSGGSQLVSLMRAQIGTNPTGWSHQWCGKQLDQTLRRAGYRGGGNLARGYASYGRPTHARVGAIAVMNHHVGVVTAVGPGYVRIIAGNHSGRSGHRVVGEGTYSMSRIIAFRAP